MVADLKFILDSRGIDAFKGSAAAIKRALYKAGQTALRDMRSEAKKRIRQRKRIKAGLIGKVFVMNRPKGSSIDGAEWALKVRGGTVPLIAYPHKQTPRPVGPKSKRRNRPGGVRVEVNKGKRTLVKGAFVATMRSGHKGIFVRTGAKRLPIRELLGSRPVDALLHRGEAEAVRDRGQASMAATFERLLPIELDKARGKLGGGKGDA